MKIREFSQENLLSSYARVPQAQYLRCYLSDLGARWVIEEPYFDRDYLEEHSAFYAALAARYPNHCTRAHFFDSQFTTEILDAALGGDVFALLALQKSYLGFVVLRPLPHAPLGRTVMRWYPDERERYANNPRVVRPSRDYVVHLAGLPLTVHGLAWQQQDGAVGLCATTALWSALHSSAFDDHHTVPTTTAVTRFAHQSFSGGVPRFPAVEGLTDQQMLETISRAGLTPILIAGDADDGFNQARFSTLVATLVRSRFPVLLSGVVDGLGGHVVCLTGFREVGGCGSGLQDAEVTTFYIHDDNLGPNVRHVVRKDEYDRVLLCAEAPPPRYPGPRLPDPTNAHPAFRPQALIVAVPEGLHLSPERLEDVAREVSESIADMADEPMNLSVTFMFEKLAAYLGEVLPRGLTPERLRGARRAVAESVPLMSLHVAVVRLGLGDKPVVDLLVDASDVARGQQWRAFATLLYGDSFRPIVERLSSELSFGQILTV